MGRAPQIIKDKGNVGHLKEILKNVAAIGTTGIAHTRWATHGEPSKINAHPHTDAGKPHSGGA